MTQQTRQFISAIVLVAVIVGLMAFDVHRHMLAAIWPTLTHFWDTYVQIYQN